MCEVRKSSIDTSLHFGVKKYVYSPYIAMGRVLLWFFYGLSLKKEITTYYGMFCVDSK